MACAAFCGQFSQGFGGVKAEGCSEDIRGVAQEATLEGWRECGDPYYVEGQGVFVCTGSSTGPAAAANWAPGEDELGS